MQAFDSINGRRWPKFLTAFLICSLMLCLATRFSPVSKSQLGTKSVQSRSVEPKRQHLDCDAVHWVAPVVVALFMERVTLYPPVLTAHDLPPIHFVDESLYNRPPPQTLV